MSGRRSRGGAITLAAACGVFEPQREIDLRERLDQIPMRDIPGLR